jgi:hypothetical protein
MSRARFREIPVDFRHEALIYRIAARYSVRERLLPRNALSDPRLLCGRSPAALRRARDRRPIGARKKIGLTGRYCYDCDAKRENRDAPKMIASVLPCFRASVLPCFRASVLPCFRASVLP